MSLFHTLSIFRQLTSAIAHLNGIGIIHRDALRQGPPPSWKFFQRDVSVRLRRSDRTSRKHSKCLMEWPAGQNLKIMRRSALGMIRVYNILPQDVVDTQDLKAFQKALTNLVRDRVVAGDSRWPLLLSPRHVLFQHHPLILP